MVSSYYYFLRYLEECQQGSNEVYMMISFQRDRGNDAYNIAGQMKHGKMEITKKGQSRVEPPGGHKGHVNLFPLDIKTFVQTPRLTLTTAQRFGFLWVEH